MSDPVRENRAVRCGRARELALAVGLVSLLLLATLGAGGASVAGLLSWHAALVLLLAGALVSAGLRHGSGFAPPLAPALAFGLFLGLAAGGAIQAADSYAAWLTMVELGACLAVLCLSISVGPELLSLVFWPLLAGGAVQGLYVLCQRLLFEDVRPAGSFLNVNHMGGWMVAVLLFAVAGAGMIDSRSARRIAYLLCLPILGAILLSGSRSAFLGAAAGGLWLVGERWQRASARQRAALVGLGICGLSLFVWRIGGRELESNVFRYHRVKIWNASLSIFLDKPWWGSGPGQFAVAANRFQFPDGDGPLNYDKRFSIPHSDLLRLPAEFGAPAALALFAALGCCVWELRRSDKLKGRSPAVRWALAALLAVALQALVDDPSRWPALYLLVCALLGALLARPQLPGSRTGLRYRSIMALTLLFVFLVGEPGR